MKLNDISFPHPVLGIADAIKSDISLTPEPIISSTEINYKISVSCFHNNNDINNLFQDSKVDYVCEAMCSNTLFREMYRSKSNIIEFEISKKRVKGKVEFTCLMVANQNIEGYSNSESHSDYNDYIFDIEKGEVLAFFGEFHFDADIKYEKLKAVSSLMVIVEAEDKDLDFTNIVLNKPKIEIQLPSIDYILYNMPMLSKEVNFAPIFHSSIVLYTLNIALYNLNENLDYPWAKAISYRLEHEEQFKNLSILEKDHIPKIAQRLLGNPINRLMNGLKGIIESPDENDN